MCVHDGSCYVIFDNVSAIACIEDLSARSPGNRLLDASVGAAERDTEDITFDPVSGHFYVLVEAVEQGGELLAEVYEHGLDGTPLGRAFLDLALEEQNKGLEGLGCIVRDGVVFLLGLCEGNRCKGGEAGRRPGGGRVHVFRKGRRRWKREAVIRLPKDVDFRDYASVAVRGDRIAVVSQSSSKLWIGTLATTAFAVKESGTIYDFPRDARWSGGVRQRGRRLVADRRPPCDGLGSSRGQCSGPGEGAVTARVPSALIDHIRAGRVPAPRHPTRLAPAGGRPPGGISRTATRRNRLWQDAWRRRGSGPERLAVGAEEYVSTNRTGDVAVSLEQQQALDSLYAIENVLTVNISMPQGDWDSPAHRAAGRR